MFTLPKYFEPYQEYGPSPPKINPTFLNIWRISLEVLRLPFPVPLLSVLVQCDNSGILIPAFVLEYTSNIKCDFVGLKCPANSHYHCRWFLLDFLLFFRTYWIEIKSYKSLKFPKSLIQDNAEHYISMCNKKSWTFCTEFIYCLKTEHI